MARPRQAGARDNSGRLIHGPTPETVAHHHERARRYHIPASKDPGMAETTIGILEAHGIIDADHARVATRRRETFETLFGRGVPSGSSAENVGRGLPRDHEPKRLRDQWTAYKVAVERITAGKRRLFERYVVRNEIPDWLKRGDVQFVERQPHELRAVLGVLE